MCCLYRFSESLHFPDFTVDDALQLLCIQLSKTYGLTLSEDAVAALPDLAQQVSGTLYLQAVRATQASTHRYRMFAAMGLPIGIECGDGLRTTFSRYYQQICIICHVSGMLITTWADLPSRKVHRILATGC